MLKELVTKQVTDDGTVTKSMIGLIKLMLKELVIKQVMDDGSASEPCQEERNREGI